MPRQKKAIWDYEWIISNAGRACYKLTAQQVASILSVSTTQMRWTTRWPGAPDGFAAHFADQLTQALGQGRRCAGSRDLPDGIYFDGDSLCIDQGVFMGTINIYQGCGCGCGCNGSGSGSGGDTEGGGGSGDLPISSQATKCDFATSIVPYFVESIRAWFQDVDIAITSGADLIDSVLGTITEIIDPSGLSPNAIETLTDYLALSLDGFIAAFEDPDLTLRVQENWWGRVPTGTSYSEITRANLVNLGQSLPVLWGNVFIAGTVSPRAVGEILSRAMSLSGFRSQLLISRGNANQALCEYLALENDEVYTPPPVPRELKPRVVREADYTYYYYETPFNITSPNEEIILKTEDGDSWQNIVGMRVYRDVVTGGPNPGGIIVGDIGFPSATASSNVGGLNKLLFQVGQGAPLDEIATVIAPGETNIISLSLEEQTTRGSETQLAIGCGKDLPNSETIVPVLGIGIALLNPLSSN